MIKAFARIRTIRQKFESSLVDFAISSMSTWLTAKSFGPLEA